MGLCEKTELAFKIKVNFSPHDQGERTEYKTTQQLYYQKVNKKKSKFTI